MLSTGGGSGEATNSFNNSTFTLKWITLSVSFFLVVDGLLLLFLNVASVCCSLQTSFPLSVSSQCVLAMAASAASTSILPSVASVLFMAIINNHCGKHRPLPLPQSPTLPHGEHRRRQKRWLHFVINAKAHSNEEKHQQCTSIVVDGTAARERNGERVKDKLF